MPAGRVDLFLFLTTLLRLCFLLSVAIGVRRFTLWSQVTYLADQRLTPWDLNWLQHSHALRFALMYPVLQLAKLTGVDRDVAFSWAVAVVILLTARLVDRTRALATGDIRSWTAGRLGVYALFVGLSAFMNGRLAFALLGMALLLFVLVRRETRKSSNLRTIIWFPLALWLASVSSGTFSVALGTMVLWPVSLLFARFPTMRVRDLVLCAPLALGGLAVAPLVELYVNKNVTFYGGGLAGFFNMLNHGPGRFIRLVAPEILAPVAVLSLLVGAMLLLLLLGRARSMGPPIVSVTVAGVVGVFGYSTLMMGLPGLVVLCGAMMTPRWCRRRSRGIRREPARLSRRGVVDRDDDGRHPAVGSFAV